MYVCVDTLWTPYHACALQQGHGLLFWTAFFPLLLIPERGVTKLPTAPWTRIALGFKFGVQESSEQEGLGPPRPRHQRLGKFTSGFSHILSPLPRV